MLVRRGMGDDTTGAVNPFSMSLSDLSSYLPGFFTQQVGLLPMWAWTAGAFLLAWWLFFPSGSEYRRKRRELRAEYTGAARIRRRGRRARAGVKQVFF